MKVIQLSAFAAPRDTEPLDFIPGRFEIVDRPVPSITENEVLLKIQYIGLCGSDRQTYHGKHKSVPVDRLSHIMGHEVSAQIAAVGEKVQGFQVGDFVAVEPQVTCGTCTPCRQGRFNVCEHLSVMGCHQEGFLKEYAACDPKYLHLVPKELGSVKAAIVEPLSVGIGSVKRGNIQGKRIAVVGAGCIGNCAAQAAKVLGAAEVLVADIIDWKLEYALECGIDYAVNLKEKSLKDAILENFGEEKADVIIDCVADPGVFQQIIEAARPASQIVITGNYKEPVTFFVPDIQRREISLIGHMMYVREDYQCAIQMLLENKINTEKLISHVWKLEEYADAYIAWDKDPSRVMRDIVKIGDPV